jgi:hypothetical protein
VLPSEPGGQGVAKRTWPPYFVLADRFIRPTLQKRTRRTRMSAIVFQTAFYVGDEAFVKGEEGLLCIDSMQDKG